MIAHRGDCFQGHVSRPLDCPFVVLLQEQCADEADDGCFVGKDADDIAGSLDLAVEPFEGGCGVDLGADAGRGTPCRPAHRSRPCP